MFYYPSLTCFILKVLASKAKKDAENNIRVLNDINLDLLLEFLKTCLNIFQLILRL